MHTSQQQQLPLELEQAIHAELRAGEKLVWAAQPIQRRFPAKSLGAFIFGALWTTGIVIGGVSAESESTKPNWGLLIAVSLFGIFGLLIMASPFYTASRMRRTIYFITTQRAGTLLKKRGAAVEVQNFYAHRLAAMTRKQHADGTGDLIFEQFEQKQGSGSTTVTRGFMDIREVASVERLLADTLLLDRTRAV